MASIFDPGINQPDYYVEHMKRTMQWIEERIHEVRQEEIREARANPQLHFKKLGAYECAITVEARWLQQLIAECLGKHQMLMEYQRLAAVAAAQNLLYQQRIVMPTEAKKEGL